MSLLPLFAEPNQTLPRRALYWHFPHYYPRMTPASAIRRDSWKLIHFYEQDRIELFDLRRDIGEQHDWASSHPDLAASLKRDLDAWRAEVGANAPRLHQ